MLLELKVTNFAVIDSLEVHFLRPGLNVLTGETGAGKSILLKSLSLLLGGKASPEVIRVGQEQAVVEGAFDLSYRPELKTEINDMGLESGDDLLVVRRIISRAGKHRLYINGTISTLNILERIMPRLVEITSQHEHHSLTRPLSQLNLLDEYAKLQALRKNFLEQYGRAKKIREDIEKLTAAARDREQKLDFLRFQINEIDAFNPVAGEDLELTSRHQRAKFASKLLAFAQRGENALYSDEQSVHSILTELGREGDGLVTLDSRLKNPVQALKEAAIVIEDAAYSLRDYSKSETIDEEETEKIEDRLSTLKKLQKKYGGTTEEIIAFRDGARSEFATLEKNEENLKELELELKKTLIELANLSVQLRQRRTKAARKLAEGINSEIKELNMKGTEFSVQITALGENELNSTGGDEVLFMIRSSPKDDPKPISRVASGGELSRLMLAIKQVVAMNEKHMTYLFDEVDAGVSGPTAEKVGRKLKAIGSYHQVVCITHLPQVAAFADAHFLITKEVTKVGVKSQVTELNQKERIHELGRMISGEKITAASLTHAKEMIEHVRSSTH